MNTSDEYRAAPAKDLHDAANRFMTEERDHGINGQDFLQLCDHHGLQVSQGLREHIRDHVLKINLNSIVQDGTKSRYSPRNLIEQLYNRLMGIVPEEQLKLRVDMIPAPLHRRNLRVALGPTRWGALRQRLLQERAHVCETCATAVEETSGLHAHEEWEYDLTKRPSRARLIRIGLVCQKCHGVEHFGNSFALVNEGRLPPEALNELSGHFCRVNQVSEAMWNLHLKSAFERWEQLNRRTSWEIDLGEFSQLLSPEEIAALQPNRPRQRVTTK